MALDTRNKRASAINPHQPWRGLWPVPDATVAQADRQHVSFLYSGILVAGPSEIVLSNRDGTLLLTYFEVVL